MLIQSVAGCFCLLILIILFRILYKRTPGRLRTFALAVMAVSIVVNIVYDCIVMFPDYYIESVWGRYKFGSVSENLLAYRDDSDFHDEMLKAVVRNRTVWLDDSALYYADYFSLFSKEVIPYSADDQRPEIISGLSSEDHCIGRFETFRVMDYVKDLDSLPAELSGRLKEEDTPSVFLDMDSLDGADHLLILADDAFNLYVAGCPAKDVIGE